LKNDILGLIRLSLNTGSTIGMF